jgi:hypothetical protein
VVLLLAAGPAGADLVINEVMVNGEGGNPELLEWIELYNDSPNHANLAFFDLRIYSPTDTTTFLLAGDVGPYGYLVYCRDMTRFEEHWGDSSGVWGDDLSEDYLISQLPMQLVNDAGRVSLYYLISQLYSELAWTGPGLDGFSWERPLPASDEIGQCEDPSGSTPGRQNSLTPEPIDLALTSVEPAPVDGQTRIAFEVANLGLTTVDNAILELYNLDVNAPDSIGSWITSEQVGNVDSGFSVILIGQYDLPGYYRHLIANVSVLDDYRPYNNRLAFTAPGSDYPPVTLSELMATPPSGGSEWVELKNVSDTVISLDGWRLGDSIATVPISAPGLTIFPDEYVVLASDSLTFGDRYPHFTGKLHQVSPWREFNNGSDSLRLIDEFGLPAGQFYYTEHFGDHTWSRAEPGEFEGRWGRSEYAGGSPGEPNRVRFAPSGTQTLEFSITPRIIAPDGNGVDDSALIVITSSDATSYILEIYDSDGRLVRTFEDGASDLAERYVWYGRNDSGERLPIGIYILYFEAVGLESKKSTIVVAR